MSPKLVRPTICIQKARLGPKGLKIDGQSLSNLRFADDIVLLSDNLEDINRRVIFS